MSTKIMEPTAPRDEHGRFIERDCDWCGYGRLQYERDGIWRCDGLADPGDENQELVECPQSHIDGEPFVPVGIAGKP